MLQLRCTLRQGVVSISDETRNVWLAAGIGVALLTSFVGGGQSGDIEFNRDIRPLLSDRCFTCHGPDATNSESVLRLHRKASALDDLGDGRYAIVPGKPDQSELIRRVSSDDPSYRMPRGREKLSESEIARLRRWIEQGAPWTSHWSFQPPRKSRLPAVGDDSWPSNPIDHFVLQRLEEEGLGPSPEADKATLLRRVSLDLTGLPPTPAALDRFLEDDSPRAYEAAVNRLLDSPPYGEHMALDWLYAARYGDTNGYQTDSHRDMWRWRDWVIDAFNENKPFDEFTIEQLAGDMLPEATLEQRIASAFNRNHRTNEEGGLIQEEYLVEYVSDRVETTFTVWQGLTLGCARCHDHKYDPLTQEDYYQVFAHFNNVPEVVRAFKGGNTPPFIKAPTPDQQRTLGLLDLDLAEKRRAFEALEPALVLAQSRWEKSLKDGPPIDWLPNTDLVARFGFDGSIQGSAPPDEDSLPEASVPEGTIGYPESPQRQAARFDGKTYVEAGQAGVYGHMDKLTISVWIQPAAATGMILSKERYNHRGPHGWNVGLEEGKVAVNLVDDIADNALRVRTKQPVELNRWHHIAVTYDGSRLADGVRIHVDGELADAEVLLGEISSSFKVNEPLRFGTDGVLKNRFTGLIDELRLYRSVLDKTRRTVLSEPRTVSEISRIPARQRTMAQLEKLRLGFLETAAPAGIRKAWKDLLETDAKKARYWEALPSVMVMHEVPGLRTTHVLVRGAYDRKGKRVDPGLPAVFAPLPPDAPNNRLGLARWLVDQSNPLTARVTVNRFWQKLFGTGLVRTAEDFGAQGEWPSHPELLDWLAVEFMDSGWDVKQILRTIVSSATYRQSPRITRALLRRDPQNRLLARGPRFRLRAESIRDQAPGHLGTSEPGRRGAIRKDLSAPRAVERTFRRQIRTRSG